MSVWKLNTRWVSRAELEVLYRAPAPVRPFAEWYAARPWSLAECARLVVAGVLP